MRCAGFPGGSRAGVLRRPCLSSLCATASNSGASSLRAVRSGVLPAAYAMGKGGGGKSSSRTSLQDVGGQRKSVSPAKAMAQAAYEAYLARSRGDSMAGRNGGGGIGKWVCSGPGGGGYQHTPRGVPDCVSCGLPWAYEKRAKFWSTRKVLPGAPPSDSRQRAQRSWCSARGAW